MQVPDVDADGENYYDEDYYDEEDDYGEDYYDEEYDNQQYVQQPYQTQRKADAMSHHALVDEAEYEQFAEGAQFWQQYSG